MSYILLKAIEKNNKRFGKNKYSYIIKDIDYAYSDANNYFFRK